MQKQNYLTLFYVFNFDLDLHAWGNGDRSDLLHNLSWRVKVNQPLVNAHLELVPSIGTLATR